MTTDENDGDDGEPLKVVRLVVYVPLHNGKTKEDAVIECEQIEFATVGDVDVATIRNYTDDHPTNGTATAKRAYRELFR